MNSLFQCDCVSHFSRFPWESAFFSCSTSLFMKRVLFLLDSERLGSRRKVWCGCAPKLPPFQSLCRAGFVWREGLRLSPKGHRALPFFGPADCSFEQFLSKKLDTGELQWSRICEAAHLQCFLMSCPGGLGTVLRADGHGCPAGSWRWLVATGTWCARSCRCRSKPQGKYLCCLATIWGSHM